MMDNKFRNLGYADRPPRVGTLLGTLVKCALLVPFGNTFDSPAARC